MSPVEVQPVQGKRVLMITIQGDSDSSLLLVLFHGEMWTFRTAFESYSVPVFRDNDGEYYRVLDVDLSSELQRVGEVLDGVVKNTIACVSMQGEVSKYALLRVLKDRPHLYFV